jgi:phosphoglycerate dehydrogenase-like enzyme
MPLPAEAVLGFIPEGLEVDPVAPAERTSAAAAAAMAGADVVIGDYSAEIEVTAEVVEALDRVRLIHQPSTGYESIDVDACATRGIPVTNAGRATSIAMGEHTVMATLALLKSLVWCDQQTRAGRWVQHEVVGRSLVDLQGKTVGLVGLGGAGEEAARRFAAFGCRIVYTARRRRPEAYERELGVRWAELGQLLSESDVVCLLTDLNHETRRMIDAGAISRMREGAFIVNPGRGGLVDEADLVDALRSGRLGGAALDVFATEPLPADSPLVALDNVILTPHVAGATLETRLRIIERTRDVIAHVDRGELPDGVVNGVTELRSVD